VLRRGHVRPRVALLVISIIAVVPIALHRGSFWESDIASMGPVPAADQALYERLRGEIGAAEVRYLLVAEAAGEEEALEASERIEAMLRPLVDAGVLAGFDAPSRHLPSRATQLARQAALPDADTLKENLTQALTGLPFRPDVFAPFLADAAEAKQLPLVTRETLRGTAVGLKLESLLIHRSAGGWLAMLPLQGVADEARLEAAVAAGGGERPILLDLKAESGRLLERYVGEAQVLALTGAGVILVVLFLGLRSPARVLIVAAPLAAAVLCTASAMLLVFGKLSIFNLFGLLLVVAVGSNYALFFERQGTTAGPLRERTAASLVLANLATVVGFGVLSFSMIPVLHGIGTTVAVGALLSLFFAASLAEDAYSSVKT
jgi:predicted exporter